MGKRVFVTGATGFIGSGIVRALRARGDEVVALTRSLARGRHKLGEGVDLVEGDPTAAGPWQARVAGCDAAINLAGESIAGQRWNAQFRQKLIDSRVDATRFLVEAMGAAGAARPKVLVSSSGIDYYPFTIDVRGAGGEDDDPVMTEQSPPGDTFLARLCREWEQEAMAAKTHGVRVVALRCGIVLERTGPLAKMAKPFKLFLGGRLGSGRQWVSWLHLEDTIGAYLFAIDHDELAGPMNLLSPNSVRQGDFALALGRALHRPAFVPMPAFALRLAVGPFADYILEGRLAAPAALQAAGYAFKYPQLTAALAEIYPR